MRISLNELLIGDNGSGTCKKLLSQAVASRHIHMHCLLDFLSTKMPPSGNFLKESSIEVSLCPVISEAHLNEL